MPQTETGINKRDEMGFRILRDKVANNLERIQREKADSFEKLSSGQKFTAQNPSPADRAISDGFEFRVRSLQASKRNVNDAVSMVQTAEGSMTEINNMISRMKELTISASNTTISDRDRRYLFLEYQALHDEITRSAQTTQFNGIPLLNGQSEDAPESIVFRLDAPFDPDGLGDDDINTISFDQFREIVATADGLGIKSAEELIRGSSEDEGIAVEDVEDLLLPEDSQFSTVFDEALHTLSTQRSIFGALQTRLVRALDFIDVTEENYSAAKSKIADTDYAAETARLTELNILSQAATSLLSQANFGASVTVNLLSML
jgi:flagellin